MKTTYVFLELRNVKLLSIGVKGVLRVTRTATVVRLRVFPVVFRVCIRN
jgi:hypothetical protein